MNQLAVTAGLVSALVLALGTSQDAPAPKLPVPSQAAQSRAEKDIKALYRAEYSRTGAAEMRELARKLAKQALDTRDDPASRFVLLQEAAALASKAGTHTEAFQSIDQLAKEYEVDGLALKANLLANGASAAANRTAHRSVADAALTVVDEAIAGDRFQEAQQLLALAERAAKSVDELPLTTRVTTSLNELRDIEKEFQRAKVASATLKTQPDDAAANLELGRYLCYFKGQWSVGLPLLVKSADKSAADVAKADLANPANAPEQVHVGDGWWDRAEQSRGLAQRNLQLRAAFWYERALPKLEGGLTRSKVEKRYNEIAARLPTRSLLAAQSAKPTFLEIKRYEFKDRAIVRMLPKEDGFCMLSHLAGQMEGLGETVAITLDREGNWCLSGQMGTTIGAGAFSLREPAWRKTFQPQVREFTWKNGMAPIKMLKKGDGFCFLSSVSGKFAGAGESVAVYVGQDNHWYLGGRAGQPVSAKAIAVTCLKPGSFDAEVKEHIWRNGDDRLKLLPVGHGFCFLSGVGGAFRGGGESVLVHIENDAWYLTCKTGQPSLTARAISIGFKTEPSGQ